MERPEPENEVRVVNDPIVLYNHEFSQYEQIYLRNFMNKSMIFDI